MEPIPPNTAATKALIPGAWNRYKVSGKDMPGYNSTPATAARPDPIAKVSAMVPSIDSHQLCRSFILRYRQHGLTGFGLINKEHQGRAIQTDRTESSLSSHL